MPERAHPRARVQRLSAATIALRAVPPAPPPLRLLTAPARAPPLAPAQATGGHATVDGAIDSVIAAAKGDLRATNSGLPATKATKTFFSQLAADAKQLTRMVRGRGGCSA